MPESNDQHHGGSIGAWADTGLMVLVIALIIWLLRRQSVITDNIGNKMDGFTARIEAINGEIVAYKESWDTRKEGLLDIVANLCHERQDACASHMLTRIAGVERQAQSVCKKIDEVKTDRTRKWDKQEELNQKLLLNNKRKNHGK